VQQIFTIYEPLDAVQPGRDLVIQGVFDTGLQPVLVSADEGVLFHLPGASREALEQDGGVLRYSGAIVRDARGREIYAELLLQDRDLSLVVPGRWLAGAEYPVVIDPMIGSPALVSDPRDEQGELDVAYNPDGGEYLVVWSGYDTGGADADLEAQRVRRCSSPQATAQR
jgi:hypothetical protein